MGGGGGDEIMLSEDREVAVGEELSLEILSLTDVFELSNYDEN